MSPPGAESSGRRRVLLMASSMRGGGSEHQTAMLLENLDRSRFEPLLYLSNPVGELLDRLPKDVPILSPHLNEGWGPKIARRFPGGTLRQEAHQLGQFVRQHQIEVVYDRTFHATLLASHRSAAIDVPRVSTIVSPPDQALPSVERRFVAIKKRRLARAYQRSHKVIAVSDAVAQSAIRYYGLDADRVVVIANPVDAPLLRQRFGELRQPDDQPDVLTLVCVGRMSREKGHVDLIEAFARWARRDAGDLPRVVLRLIGDGPDRDSLHRFAAEQADADGQTAESVSKPVYQIGRHEIRFEGVISPAAGEIARADGLVLPSHFEGMPNVVLEAFALSVPVIATRSGGTCQLQASAEQPTCFWADPGDVRSLVEALNRFVESPLQRVQHQENAHRLLASHHSVERQIELISEQLSI